MNSHHKDNIIEELKELRGEAQKLSGFTLSDDEAIKMAIELQRNILLSEVIEELNQAQEAIGDYVRNEL